MSSLRVKKTVDDTSGNCQAFISGDQIVIDGADVRMDETDGYCVWVALFFVPYLIAVREGVPARAVGLGEDADTHLIPYLDPSPPRTPGSTFRFRIEGNQLISDGARDYLRHRAAQKETNAHIQRLRVRQSHQPVPECHLYSL